MARYTILSAVLAVSLVAGTAFAKDKQSDSYMVVKDANGQEAKVLKAQFIRPGDVSPEEYARLLAEADRIRAYQGQAQAPQYQQVQQYAQQPQYAQQQYTGQVSPANPLPPQANAQITYNSMTGKAPQTYTEYMAAKRATLAQAQQAQLQAQAQQSPMYVQQPQTVYQTPQPTQPTQQAQYSYANPVYTAPQQQRQQAYIPAPQPTSRYLPPSNNRVIYAGMPDVVNASPSITTVVPRHVAAPVPAVGHSVVKGDTLYSLSKRYGMKVNDLKAANGLTSDTISIGQVLAVPGVVVAAQPQYTAPVATQSPVKYQTPTQGAQYYTRTSTTAAQPTPRVVRAVQPVPPAGVYAVLPNDTIFSVSNFACVNPYDVAKLNGLTDTTNLTPGQKLNMPVGHCLNN